MATKCRQTKLLTYRYFCAISFFYGEFRKELQVNAAIRFLSVEPLLQDLGAINLTDIHWVIVGGESGPKARPMNQEWVLSIKEQCEKHGSAFFFKQWGTWGMDKVKRGKKANGRMLLGRTWSSYPTQVAAN